MRELQRYNWPGNIRELQHVLERALITSKSGRISPELNHGSVGGENPTSTVDRSVDTVTYEVLTAAELRVFEATNIQRAMAQTGGKIYGGGGAAELLDMKPTTLASRIKSLGIDTDS